MKPEHLYKLLSTEQIGSDAWYKIIRDFIDEQDIKNVSIQLGKLSYKNDWYRHVYYIDEKELTADEAFGIAKMCCVSTRDDTEFYKIAAIANNGYYINPGQSCFVESTLLNVKTFVLGVPTYAPITNQLNVYLFYNSFAPRPGPKKLMRAGEQYTYNNEPVLYIKK